MSVLSIPKIYRVGYTANEKRKVLSYLPQIHIILMKSKNDDLEKFSITSRPVKVGMPMNMQRIILMQSMVNKMWCFQNIFKKIANFIANLVSTATSSLLGSVSNIPVYSDLSAKILNYLNANFSGWKFLNGVKEFDVNQ